MEGNELQRNEWSSESEDVEDLFKCGNKPPLEGEDFFRQRNELQGNEWPLEIENLGVGVVYALGG